MAGLLQTTRLGTLDLIYRLSGSRRSPDEIDIERPLTVVHDVSTHAGHRSIAYGTINQGLIIAASTEDFVSVFADDVLVDEPDALPPVGQRNTWILDACGVVLSSQAAAFENAFLTGWPTELATGQVNFTQGLQYRIKRWTFVLTGTAGDPAGGAPHQWLEGDAGVMVGNGRLPRTWERIDFSAISNAVGTLTVRAAMLVAISPKGVIPPYPYSSAT